MKTNVTPAARKIARTHNAQMRKTGPGSGFLVFAKDGTGGAWYTDNARPAVSDGHLIVGVKWQSMTAAQAQEIIELAN